MTATATLGWQAFIDRWHVVLAAQALVGGLIASIPLWMVWTRRNNGTDARYDGVRPADVSTGKATHRTPGIDIIRWVPGWMIAASVLHGLAGVLAWTWTAFAVMGALGAGWMLSRWLARSDDHITPKPASPYDHGNVPAFSSLGTIAITASFLSLWGVWAAVPDTESPLIFAATFTPGAAAALAISFAGRFAQSARSVSSTRGLNAHLAFIGGLLVSGIVGVFAGSILGSVSAASVISGFGCIGATPEILVFGLRRPQRMGAVNRRAATILMIIHAASVVVCSRLTHARSIAAVVVIVGLTHVVGGATAAAALHRRPSSD